MHGNLPRKRRAAAAAEATKVPGKAVDALFGQARAFLEIHQQGKPLTAKKRAAFEKFRTMLASFDEADRVLLGEMPGAPWKPVQEMQEQVDLVRKTWEIPCERDEFGDIKQCTPYRLYTKFLVQAYVTKFGRSPAGVERYRLFRAWVNGYGLPAPSRPHVLFWTRRIARAKAALASKKSGKRRTPPA